MCQLPSCNLFTQHYIVLWRDTSSELWTLVLLFIISIQPAASCFPVFLLQAILFPFDTINPLFSARPVGLTTSLSSWGKVIWLWCAGLYFNLGAILVSYWFDNLSFILREILAAVYITTFLLGFPNLTALKHQRISGVVDQGMNEATPYNSPSLTPRQQWTAAYRFRRPIFFLDVLELYKLQ